MTYENNNLVQNVRISLCSTHYFVVKYVWFLNMLKHLKIMNENNNYQSINSIKNSRELWHFI